MEQNLNIINQENNDLQIELDQKDGVIFDLRKLTDKNEGIVKELRGCLDRANKKNHKNEDLIVILNQDLLSLKLQIGNAKYEQKEKQGALEELEAQNKGELTGINQQHPGASNLTESFQEIVTQSADLEQ